jgi:lysophospholipase L1-like esterase
MAAFEEDFQAWRKSRAEVLLDDFGELCRYREANAALKPAGPGESRVVFFGDSITEGWNLEEHFPGKPYINRSICAQTTPQMLVRFRPDVIALGARVAVILAGTNDIGGNTGPMSLEEIAANLASMADIAKAHGVRAVFSSLLPPAHEETLPSRFNLLKHPLDRVLSLNAWLEGYCAANGLEFIDYFSAMSGPDGLVRPELSEDGLHPTALGYQIMAPLAEAAIRHALTRELPGRAPAPNPGS